KKNLKSQACLWISTVLGMCSLWLGSPASGQTCGTGLGGEINVSPSIAHVGDTITINFVDIFSSLNTCQVTNGKAWLIYPDNSVRLWLDNFTLNPQSIIQCPGSAPCLPFTTTYVVQAADINRTLSFQTNFPTGFNFTCGNAGSPNTIQFEVAASGNASTDPASLASACQTRGVRIVNPRVACTKNCINGVGENGAISFSGTVTNTGYTALINIAVSNLVNGSLSLVTNISMINTN